MTKDEIDREDLPDRWDGDVWEFGKQVLPKLGPKVGIHWGHLLMLEKYLRDIQDGLGDVLKADAVDHPFDPDDFTDVCFEASQTLDLAQWLETQARGLRTGEWPDEEHEESDQAPPEDRRPRRLDDLFPFLRDDPDVPF